MELDFERCYRAAATRDGRFDGFFFTAVTSTRIYCRPSCPALMPKRENVRFLPSAAAAQREGFRACLRCRPDAAPGSPEWNVRADVVARAVRLIADGVVDRSGVPGLAARLGYTERHLHRLLTAELGAGPIALARAQRAQTARILIETTTLGLADVAFASGFGSVRQFNDTIREIYGRAPSQLREKAAPAGGALRLRLPYRAPLHADALLDFLGHRTVPGIDARDGDTYTRTMRLPHGVASVTLKPVPGYVNAELTLADVRDLAPAVSRCRRLLDLDADPEAIDEVLAADPTLAEEVRKNPGVRSPGATDGLEIAVRAVVGQQVSVASARTVLSKLVVAAGGAFPDAAGLLALPDNAFAMPTARRGTLRALAAAVGDGLDLDGGGDRDEVRAALLDLPGVGSWTTDYIALRALGDPDVFLPTDLGVRRGAAALGLPSDPKRLAAHAERWRPWRSYAVIRLWRHA
ncbi:DNA-3-methyladenine glycosylase [Virgisporangium aliadipatigenens]|uniref:DNA-3-methyladenine glycosylase II n=1 Tax=Virgisporangium aliadipatigenens TaxID=741659 RepID=A0A8J3YRG1_9ACTN|nr:AlkA N-terminal domain-containing protein [Virgisporangium aliadipatigenens]GIJ50086.1 DNA-3-methyladenine glycosylase [Virgisporangium aliadipatigenens]